MPETTLFRKILVANRSEVAVRIIRTARQMGYRTVAVYSTVDADAFHVHAADEAVCIGEPEPSASYLNIPALLEAARLSGADAVHPGYGFLAENGEFADACRGAGLVFIGPSGQAIRQMGNKARAKALMLDAGVPCVPGYQGEDQSASRLMAEARRIGFPVMIKACGGGGGRGMRIVHTAEQFEELLRSARAEAQNAFGNPDVILERAIVQPRHIEIQVAADRHGNVIHLGERDCSVQRRHQKLIEEAPSPAVTDELRAEMGAVAVMAARAIQYESLGTMEFLLDRDGHFYFMEMNTRLQVEHPVTEAVTGLDLVELQLRIAMGLPLPLRQEDVALRGHAIEVRLCAENPTRDFMPDSGTLSAWRPAHGVRVEHALAEGAAIPPFYDSMFAKLIAHGQDRTEATRRIACGLEDTVALGIHTNREFLHRCVTHEAFMAGRVTTAFLDEHRHELLSFPDGECQRALALGAALMLETGRGCSLASGLGALEVEIRLRLDAAEQESVVTLIRDSGGSYRIGSKDRSYAVRVAQLHRGQAKVICDGLMETVTFVREDVRLLFQSRGCSHELLDIARAQRWDTALRVENERGLVASTSGKITAILVSVGQGVSAGEPMLVMEAMKMEHIYNAPASGTVTTLNVGLGRHVHAGHLLAEIKS